MPEITGDMGPSGVLSVSVLAAESEQELPNLSEPGPPRRLVKMQIPGTPPPHPEFLIQG